MITTISIPPKIIFGPGAINQLTDEAKAIGRKKLMIVTYPDIRRVGHLDKVLKLLAVAGITDPIIFEKVMPNPRVTMIDEGAALARQEKVDFIIGLGGGSAMDSAKAIGLASTGTKSVWEYLGSGASGSKCAGFYSNSDDGRHRFREQCRRRGDGLGAHP